MKKTILILIILLTATYALALDNVTIQLKVTINKAPGIGSLLPNDGDSITEGDVLEISVDANDPNNDILEYRFYINGAIIQPWTTQSSHLYTLTKDDIGLNKIKAEVTDGMETISTQEVEIYVFRKSLALPSSN